MWTNDLLGLLRLIEGDFKVTRDPHMCGVVFVHTKAEVGNYKRGHQGTRVSKDRAEIDSCSTSLDN